jgi:uncharacterized coiled-coil protein SlyX
MNHNIEKKQFDKKTQAIAVACGVLLAIGIAVMAFTKGPTFISMPHEDKKTVKQIAEVKEQEQTVSSNKNLPEFLTRALKEAIQNQSFKDLDQALVNITLSSALSKKQKFDLLWGAYENFKNSKVELERKAAQAVLQAIVSIDTKHTTAQLIQELSSNSTDSAAKNTLSLALTRQFEMGNAISPESRDNNQAILAALKARTSDTDMKVAAAAVFDYSAIAPPEDAVPVLDNAMQAGQIIPWEYASRLISQLYNIRDAGFQLETMQKIINVLTEHAADFDLQRRVLRTFPETILKMAQQSMLHPQTVGVLQPLLQKLNPVAPVGAPTLILRTDRLEFETLMRYPVWLETTSLLSGVSLQKATDSIAKNQNELNSVPEVAAALLLARNGAEFEKQIRSHNNAQLLASALIRRASAIPKPNDVSQQFIDLAARLSA